MKDITDMIDAKHREQAELITASTDDKIVTVPSGWSGLIRTTQPTQVHVQPPRYYVVGNGGGDDGDGWDVFRTFDALDDAKEFFRKMQTEHAYIGGYLSIIAGLEIQEESF